MRRWAMFTPVVAVVVLAGVMGLRLGDTPTETEIINHYADRYLTEAPAGAALTDCLGRPGDAAAVRLIVVCTHPGGTVFQYPVGEKGDMIPQLDPQGPAA